MFCENRDNPMSSCNGQCYLDKQLDQASQEQDSDWMSFRADFYLFTLFSNDFEIRPKPFDENLIHHSFYRIFHYTSERSNLDKPPKS